MENSFKNVAKIVSINSACSMMNNNDLIIEQPHDPIKINSLTYIPLVTSHETTLRPISLIQQNINNLGEQQFLVLELNGKQVIGVLDSGSVHSYLVMDLAKEWKSKNIPQFTFVSVADGNSVNIEGLFDTTVTIDQDSRTLAFHVSDGILYGCILGIDFMRLMKISMNHENDTWWTPKGIQHQFYPYSTNPFSFIALASLVGLVRTETKQNKIIQLLNDLIPPTTEMRGVTTLATHEIDVQDHEPMRQGISRYSPQMSKMAQEEVDRMLHEGIIEPSDSPQNRCPVLAPKPNKKYRFFIDYRQVNDVTNKFVYPVENMGDILDKLRCARYISKLDLSQAYHQISKEPDSKEITAFAV